MGKRAQSVDCECQSAATKEDWTFELPLQRVWVPAEARHVELGPEADGKFVEGGLDLSCRVQLETTTDQGPCESYVSDVWQLVASCPFCEEGRDQILKSSEWVRVEDWENMTVDKLNPYKGWHLDEKIHYELGAEPWLSARFFRDFIEEWGPEGPIMPNRGSGSANVYGIRIADMRDAIPRSANPHAIEGCTVTERFGIRDLFGGLYRCPHCGNIFAAICYDERFRAPDDSIELLAPFKEAIARLAAMQLDSPSGMFAYTQLVGRAEPISVSVVPKGEEIRVEANVDGAHHAWVLDTRRGDFRLDGNTYVRKESFDVYEMSRHPLFHAGLFGIREIVDHLARLLPPLPEGVDFEYGAGQSARNLTLLLCANRFLGYPASFYEELAKGSFALYEIFPLHAGLPRSYADVPALLEQTRLPDAEPIRRVLLGRPTALFTVLKYPDVPFTDIDVLCRFLERKDLRNVLVAVNAWGNGCEGWRKLGQAKGESAVLEFMLRLELDDLAHLSYTLYRSDGALMGFNDLGLDDITSQEVKKLIACQDWQTDHPELGIDCAYEYDEHVKRLEGVSCGYAFELPKTPREIIVASVGRRMHLDACANIRADAELPMIVFMRREGDIVGVVHVNLKSGKVVSAEMMTGVLMKYLKEESSALREWAAQRSLELDD